MHETVRRGAWYPIWSLAILLVLLPATPSLGTEGDWWQDAVFYEVFVRSFQDSDGDGIGDLQGLIDRLDYLNDGNPETTDDLGVTALWLMPICPSPSYHGYDVTDYYTIDPEYGTLEDFRDVLREAHQRGIRVIVDLVLNHTSTEHPWFRASRGPSSSFRNWYIWTFSLPSYRGPWGQPVWHFGGAGYYYGLFWSGMPDLNYRNPEVTAQMLDVVRFWLYEIGVDGFRLDAVRHLIEDGQQQENTVETHAWLKDLRTATKDVNSEALLLGEVWDDPAAIVPYYDEELDLCFEFSLAEAILAGVNGSNAGTIEGALHTVRSTYAPGHYATFLANHDQERTMTRLGGDLDKAKLAASIQFTLPGAPFIYYGEEIGMTGGKPDERIRTPMQWSQTDRFTVGEPWQPYSSSWPSATVFEQLDREASLLGHYRRLIDLRSHHDALRTGALDLVETGHLSILSYVRRLDETMLWIQHNLSSLPARASQLVPTGGALEEGTYDGVDLWTGESVSLRLDSAGQLVEGASALPPRGSRILRLIPTP